MCAPCRRPASSARRSLRSFFLARCWSSSAATRSRRRGATCARTSTTSRRDSDDAAMPPRSVVLIGFMASGKTAVGRALADQLGFEFCDTDELVTSAAGRTVEEIFADEGEDGFRSRERDAVVRAAARPGRVIACGGGAILSVRNYGVLKGAGPICYLRTTAEELI